ncbi:type II CAAX endopeptidase family protein [Aureispira sp. CCB-E]|uniref:CPBP family intramembrane glutamic endopeptidase n=1 Tax=Aureispira sp. CCB-E TaxID=3051121 RepID=UPI002868FD1F|nr:type II CAAX endopeptidase family protein [Aureispira sp. CCB-E]WMX15020.1 type II CAAX endopeptidase family protein [Aureispira sp. CCB-E]
MENNYIDRREQLKNETFLFLFIWFGFYVVGMIVVQLLAALFGLPDFSKILNGITKGEYLEYLDTLKVLQLIVHLFQYLIPALVFIFLYHKKNALKIVYANKTPMIKNIFWSLLLVASIYPFISFIYYWNTQLLPDSIISQEKLDIQSAFLEMNTPKDLILNLLLLGLAAGIGEEFLFRGILQRLLTLWTQNIHYGAILTGFIFSLMHFQLEGFVPRFLLGVIFCYLLIFTGNLWITVLVHVFFNSFQVIIPYFSPNLAGNINDIESVPFLLAGISSLIFLLFLAIFKKINQEYKYIKIN